MKPIKILLIEDNSGDVELIKQTLLEGSLPHIIFVANDGVSAMDFLANPENRPDIIILDLNLPRKSGKEVLKEVKTNIELKNIPVVILTSSEAISDIEGTYSLGANSYLTKPLDFDGFSDSMSAFEKYWLSIVKLPKK